MSLPRGGRLTKLLVLRRYRVCYFIIRIFVMIFTRPATRTFGALPAVVASNSVEIEMKFTLSWLKDHLDTGARCDEIVDTLTMIGLEVERVEDKAKEYEPFKVVQILDAEQHPNADRLRVCKVDNGTGTPLQIVCGAPNARAGLKTVLGLPGTYIPGQGHHAVGRQDPRRRKPGHDDLRRGDRLQRRPQRHHRDAGRRADRHAVRRGARHRRAGDRDQPHAEPLRLHRRQRHRPRPRRHLDRRLQGERAEAHRRHVPLPGEGDDRDAGTVPGLRAQARARRQERPVAGMAAETAHGHRPASDQRAGRHHQLHHLRPRPAAARVRRQEGEGQPHRPPRRERRDTCWRSTARPTRSTRACA